MGEGAERSGTEERNGTERRSVPAERNGGPFRSVRNGTERNGGVSEMGRNGTERNGGTAATLVFSVADCSAPKRLNGPSSRR